MGGIGCPDAKAGYFGKIIGASCGDEETAGVVAQAARQQVTIRMIVVRMSECFRGPAAGKYYNVFAK